MKTTTATASTTLLTTTTTATNTNIEEPLNEVSEISTEELARLCVFNVCI
jgi:hypothetical protein